MDNNTTSQTAASTDISRRRRPRFLLLALTALVAGLALVAGACKDSGESESSKESDSAEVSDGDSDSGNSDSGNSDADSDSGSEDSTGTDSEDSSTDGSDSGETDPVDTEAAQKQLEAATTSCEVLDSMEALFGSEDPTTAEEARAFVDTFVTLVNKMAETTSDPTLAGQLETAANNLRKFAEDNNYEPAAMNFSGQPDYPGVEEDFAAVDQWYETEIGNCMPDVGTAPTP